MPPQARFELSWLVKPAKSAWSISATFAPCEASAEALTAPWTVRQAYVRAEGLDHLVMDTFSNDRTSLEDGLFAILPPEEEP